MIAGNITVEVNVDAGIEKVWDYWTLPEHIEHWNFASDDWECPFAENDLMPGGAFSYKMAAKDGSMEFQFEGIYDEVIPHELIQYTLGDGRKVRVEFQSKGKTTHVIETFEPEEVNTLELQRTGWQAILDNFRKYLEEKQ